jgi:hypothetical protein
MAVSCASLHQGQVRFHASNSSTQLQCSNPSTESIWHKSPEQQSLSFEQRAEAQPQVFWHFCGWL